MAYPLPVTEQPLQLPASRPLLAVGILRDAAGSSSNYTSGSAAGSLLRYPGLDSFAWWVDPDLSAPVRVHLSESLNGVFADARIEVTHLPVDAAGVAVGHLRSIDTDVRPGEAWYTWRVASRSDQAGLVTLTGETLMGRLARTRPREALILIAGEGGVPAPLDLREALRRFLLYYGVPFVDDLPAFLLRSGDETLHLTVPAFVIQPDQENPESVLDWLERFFAPFRGYAFRADAEDRLVVTPPAWVVTLGLRMVLYRRRQELDRHPLRIGAHVPWSSARRPTVAWSGTVDGTTYSGELAEPLERGAPYVEAHVGPITVRLRWREDNGRVEAITWPPPSSDVSVGSLYTITFTVREEASEKGALELLPAELAPDAVVTVDADRVVNQAAVRVLDLDWQSEQQVMQAAALVLRSPGGIMPGLFGNTPFGPMQEELESPSGFHELGNEVAEGGTWFWPVDGNVVIQPGGNITVAFDVEEWAERWNEPRAPHEPGFQANTFSESVDLPANGEEVKLFDLQFPRQTSNFAPSPYGARGSVYGRWRAGAEPGIEVRVGNGRFVEFGYLAELGPFGTTTYFLWGVVIKLNGSGVTFTTGDTHVHRFGYAQAEDGSWEGGAVVPALAESQAAYPSRSLEVTLPYALSPEEGIAVARGIVEENLHPRAVHHLTLVPNPARGWPVTPAGLGRVVNVPSDQLQGRVTSVTYDELHTAASSTTSVVVEVEETGVIPGSRTLARAYGQATYRLSPYQQEE